MDSFDFNALRESLGLFGFLVSFGFWYRTYISLKWAAILFSAVFISASVWAIVSLWPLRKKLYVFEGHRAYKLPQAKRNAEEEERIGRRRKWDAIIKKAEAVGPQGYAMSVIEADILLEDTMGRLGFLGKNLAERLRSAAPGELPNINDIWEAHKLRNKIAHEPNFRLSKEETIIALGVYKKTLEGLAAI